MDQLLTPQEAANRLGTSLRFVRPARLSAPHPLRQGWPARAYHRQRPGRLHRRRPGGGTKTAGIAAASECLAWPTSSDASATAR
jgi:hypothetical protein